MDHDHFDGIARSFSTASRRGLGRALAGGGLAALFGSVFSARDSDAKKKGGKKKKKKKSTPSGTCTPRCGRKQCGDDGCGGSCGSCHDGQVCASGTCCTPEPVSFTCVVDCGHGEFCPRRCDTVHSSRACGAVACTCPSGEVCLGNSSCARTCDPTTGSCPSGSGCRGSTDGAGHCYAGGTCGDHPQVCTSSTECPLGYSCQKTMCGPGPTGSPQNRCWPLGGLF